MRLLILLLFSIPTFAYSMIRPVPATSAPEQFIVKCTFENPNLDVTELYLEADGTLTAKTNQNYKLADPNLAPFLRYKGLAMQIEPKTLSAQGDLASTSGVTLVDLHLQRNTTQKVIVEGQSLSCETK